MEMKQLRIADCGLRIDLFKRGFCNPKSAIRNPQWIASLVTILSGTPALAQAPEGAQSKPWFVSLSHYGKWAALAGAGGLLTKGALRHRDANREFQTLTHRCRQTPTMCEQNPNGVYLNGEIEALSQRSRDLHHNARNWILAGEASLLTTGTMFIVDVLYHHEEPKNIPYSPFSVYAERDRIGLFMRF